MTKPYDLTRGRRPQLGPPGAVPPAIAPKAQVVPPPESWLRDETGRGAPTNSLTPAKAKRKHSKGGAAHTVVFAESPERCLREVEEVLGVSLVAALSQAIVELRVRLLGPIQRDEG